MRRRTAAAVALSILGCSSDPSAPTASATSVAYEETFTGGEFHLGPVDWDETEWHNACAPATKYASSVRAAEGTLLAGLWGGLPNVAGYCDACIRVETAISASCSIVVPYSYMWRCAIIA